MSNKQVAILIDFENIGIDAMSFVVEQSSKHGRIIINRAYADWTTTRGIKEILQELKGKYFSSVNVMAPRAHNIEKIVNKYTWIITLKGSNIN